MSSSDNGSDKLALFGDESDNAYLSTDNLVTLVADARRNKNLSPEELEDLHTKLLDGIRARDAKAKARDTELDTLKSVLKTRDSQRDKLAGAQFATLLDADDWCSADVLSYLEEYPFVAGQMISYNGRGEFYPLTILLLENCKDGIRYDADDIEAVFEMYKPALRERQGNNQLLPLHTALLEVENTWLYDEDYLVDIICFLIAAYPEAARIHCNGQLPISYAMPIVKDCPYPMKSATEKLVRAYPESLSLIRPSFFDDVFILKLAFDYEYDLEFIRNISGICQNNAQVSRFYIGDYYPEEGTKRADFFYELLPKMECLEFPQSYPMNESDFSYFVQQLQELPHCNLEILDICLTSSKSNQESLLVLLQSPNIMLNSLSLKLIGSPSTDGEQTLEILKELESHNCFKSLELIDFNTGAVGSIMQSLLETNTKSLQRFNVQKVHGPPIDGTMFKKIEYQGKLNRYGREKAGSEQTSKLDFIGLLETVIEEVKKEPEGQSILFGLLGESPSIWASTNATCPIQQLPVPSCLKRKL